MQQKSERRQRTKSDTKPPLALPAREPCENLWTCVSAKELKQAILDNLYSLQGRIPEPGRCRKGNGRVKKAAGDLRGSGTTLFKKGH